MFTVSTHHEWITTLIVFYGGPKVSCLAKMHSPEIKQNLHTSKEFIFQSRQHSKGLHCATENVRLTFNFWLMNIDQFLFIFALLFLFVSFFFWKFTIALCMAYDLLCAAAWTIVVIIYKCLSFKFASWLSVLRHTKYTCSLIIRSFIFPFSPIRLTVNCAHFFIVLLVVVKCIWCVYKCCYRPSKLLLYKNSLYTILSTNAFIIQRQRCLFLVRSQKFQHEIHSHFHYIDWNWIVSLFYGAICATYRNWCVKFKAYKMCSCGKHDRFQSMWS